MLSLFLIKSYRVDVFEGINVNKTSTSKECIICHYCYFLDEEFTFQPTACNDCHDVLMMFIDINSIVILSIHVVDFCCIIVGITKSEATNL